ncbi:MAG: hypothetical protein AABW67_05710 [Nanoarchaeota archaeon]
MNLYEIKQRLEEQEKAVFSLNEITRIIRKSKNITSVYLNRMCKKKFLFKIEKNKFSKTKDIFVIASQLIYPSYLGLTTSLYLQDEFSQIINKIYILTTKQKKKMKILDTEIKFIKIKPISMFGYKKIKKENSFIFVSDLERTIIDVILFQNYSRISNLLGLIKKSDTERLLDYTRIINKEVLIRKIGFLLDSAKINHNLKRKTKTIYKYNPGRKEKGKFNNKWFLYINEVFE